MAARWERDQDETGTRLVCVGSQGSIKGRHWVLGVQDGSPGTFGSIVNPLCLSLLILTMG